MSDKLQEIKQLANNAIATGEGHVDLTTYALTWLIEQLEQAQADNAQMKEKYDDVFERMTYAHKDLVEVEATNQKLVECLEWYADGQNYVQKPYITENGSRLFKSKIDEDKNGYRARALLQELQQSRGEDES